MNEKPCFLIKHLSAFLGILFYIAIVVFHLLAEGFLPGIQFDLIATLLPFIVLAGILDFILSHNTKLASGYRILAQLMSACVLGMMFLSTSYYAEKNSSIKIFNFLLWLFLSLPFFIAGYYKELHWKKLKYSLIGTALIAAVYLYLTTITDELNESHGAVIFFLSCFFMLYAASSPAKFPFFGTILGDISAAVLLFFRFVPITADAKLRGWDSDIAFKFELILMATFIISVIIQLISVLKKDNLPAAEETADTY